MAWSIPHKTHLQTVRGCFDYAKPQVFWASSSQFSAKCLGSSAIGLFWTSILVPATSSLFMMFHVGQHLLINTLHPSQPNDPVTWHEAVWSENTKTFAVLAGVQIYVKHSASKLRQWDTGFEHFSAALNGSITCKLCAEVQASQTVERGKFVQAGWLALCWWTLRGRTLEPVHATSWICAWTLQFFFWNFFRLMDQDMHCCFFTSKWHVDIQCQTILLFLCARHGRQKRRNQHSYRHVSPFSPKSSCPGIKFDLNM